MYWFFTALIAAIVVAIALIAAGRGDSMAQAWSDRRYLSLPEDRSLTAEDLDSLRLALAFRGYRMDEVDDLLDRLGDEIAARDAYIDRLRGDLARLREIDRANDPARPFAVGEAGEPAHGVAGEQPGSWTLPTHGRRSTQAGTGDAPQAETDQSRTSR
jgi:DivIVA domain-containing protein